MVPAGPPGPAPCVDRDGSAEDDGFVEIDEVRRAGYSIDRGRYIGGIVIVAVPVLGGGPLTHAIAAIGLAEQLDSATAIRLAEDMQESARALAGQYRLFA